MSHYEFPGKQLQYTEENVNEENTVSHITEATRSLFKFACKRICQHQWHSWTFLTTARLREGTAAVAPVSTVPTNDSSRAGDKRSSGGTERKGGVFGLELVIRRRSQDNAFMSTIKSDPPRSITLDTSHSCRDGELDGRCPWWQRLALWPPPFSTFGAAAG